MFPTALAVEISDAAHADQRAAATSAFTALLTASKSGTATTSAAASVVVGGGTGIMGAPAREGGEEGCKVGETEEAGEEGEAGLRVVAASATAKTTINPRR